MRAVTFKKISWCAVLLLIIAADAQAQRRGGSTRRRTATTTTTTTTETTDSSDVVNPATGNAVEAPPAAPANDPAAAAPLRQDGVGTPVSDTPRKSLRVDGVTSKNSVRDRVPIAYDNIREDDKFWEKRIWQVIDIREKMNLPFQYNVEDENGINQLFINILLASIKSGEITAFNPIDDRFTTPMTFEEIQSKTSGEERTVRSIDPVTGEEKMVTTRDEFDPRTIVQYKIKEVWVFDKRGLCTESTYPGYCSHGITYERRRQPPRFHTALLGILP